MKLKNIEKDNIPTHTAIIMDGNGRWAKQRGFERIFGHKNSIKAVREAVEGCVELGVKYITLYTFSSENWNRPQKEINGLMELILNSLEKELVTFTKNGIKFNYIGELDKLSDKVLNKMKVVKEKTLKGENAILTLAISYGSKNEIVNTAKRIAKELKEGIIKEENITESLFNSYLYTQNIPKVDLMIRTGKEKRISNFLLWQSAYAELYFCDVLWPDFRKEHIKEAILNYKKRERRFGKVIS